jgi:putative two-component system response regulator
MAPWTSSRPACAGAHSFQRKPIHAGQLLAVLEKALEHRRLLVENRRYQHHIEDMVRRKSAELSDALLRKRAAAESTLEALAALIDAREHSTGQHSLRVGRLARLLARRLGLSEKEAEEIGHGALLHDIAKSRFRTRSC